MWTTSCESPLHAEQAPAHRYGGTSHLTHHGIRTPHHKGPNCSAVCTPKSSHYLLHFVFKSTLTSMQSEHNQGMETAWADPTLQNEYIRCETVRVLPALSSVTCSDRCVAGTGTRCHLTSSSSAGQRNLQAGMGDKLNKPAVAKVLKPSVSLADYLSTPPRLRGRVIQACFPGLNNRDFVIRKRWCLKGFFCSHHKRQTWQGKQSQCTSGHCR